ncbi:hypothetical protein C8R44DRAFT_889371 [Mycena epipterygia]|nr:hypothetical protein C8R44DRAFT_889371 [Mycena epipterygia]
MICNTHATNYNSSDEETIMPSEFFWGDGCIDDMVPGDYLKLTMNKFKETSSDDFKANRFSNGFTTNSKAEIWFEVLPVVTQRDWKLLKAEFLKKWLRATVPTLSTEQHQICLQAEKLKKENISISWSMHPPLQRGPCAMKILSNQLIPQLLVAQSHILHFALLLVLWLLLQVNALHCFIW